MTKLRKFERKKLSVFRHALPTKTLFPSSEADRREAEEKKSGFSKGAENALKLVKFEMQKCKKLTEKGAFES